MAGKNTSGHRTRPFRGRCLKSLISSGNWLSVFVHRLFQQESNKAWATLGVLIVISFFSLGRD